MRTVGMKGGEEPDGEAQAVGVGCEVEGRRKEAGGGACSGLRELDVAAAVEEGGSWVGGDLPSGGRDFDDFTVGVGEIEKDSVGVAGMAAGGDASVDGQARCVGKSTGLERADGLTERVIGGRLLVFAIEGVDEPVAETGRVEGADLVAESAEGEADEGLAGGGGEGGGGGGVVEEEFGLGIHLIL
jgi:hypothetical protein